MLYSIRVSFHTLIKSKTASILEIKSVEGRYQTRQSGSYFLKAKR